MSAITVMALQVGPLGLRSTATKPVSQPLNAKTGLIIRQRAKAIISPFSSPGRCQLILPVNKPAMKITKAQNDKASAHSAKGVSDDGGSSVMERSFCWGLQALLLWRIEHLDLVDIIRSEEWNAQVDLDSHAWFQLGGRDFGLTEPESGPR